MGLGNARFVCTTTTREKKRRACGSCLRFRNQEIGYKSRVMIRIPRNGSIQYTSYHEGRSVLANQSKSMAQILSAVEVYLCSVNYIRSLTFDSHEDVAAPAVRIMFAAGVGVPALSHAR